MNWSLTEIQRYIVVAFVLALFQSATVNKIDPEHTDSYSRYATSKY